MIYRSKAPLRIGLAGGGTDVSPYSDLYGGAILNATLSLYAHATIEAFDDDRIILQGIDRQEELRFAEGTTMDALPIDGKLDLLKGVYNRIRRDYGWTGKGFRLSTFVDAPAGSGLGTSSTLVVAIIGAFSEMLRLPLGEYDMAHLAYDIERKDLQMAGGKQDQYAATFGGVNYMEFYKEDRVIVNPLRVKQSVRAELESSLVLFYTGVSRESARIIQQQTDSVRSGNSTSLDALHRVKEEAVKMKEAILKGDFDSFAESMRLSWISKKLMATSISNSSIDAIYDAAIAAGALAGKVSGAGGGGFMMFVVDPTKRPDVMRTLAQFNGQVFTCNFTEHGAYSWRT